MAGTAKPAAVVPDYYTLLEVQPLASGEVVKAAYHALMRRHHPDAHATRGEMARRLNEAHEVLGDPDRRKAYDQSRQDLTGVCLGSFRVVKEIAAGAIGQTYLGEHVLTGLPVCIKHCTFLDAAINEIVLNESKVMWGLAHFALPAIRDVVRAPDGRIAIIMQYAPGPTIAQVCATHGRMEAEHVAWITLRVLNALRYLHDHGVVHGDLKPENIIIHPESHLVTIVDFGLAMVKPTATARNLGYTQLFSPPEQEHARGPLVPASDFFALGMTMIAMLVGGIEDRIRALHVPDDVPEPLCTFIKKLVVRDVLARQFSAADLEDELKKTRKQCFGRSHSNMKPLPI